MNLTFTRDLRVGLALIISIFVVLSGVMAPAAFADDAGAAVPAPQLTVTPATDLDPTEPQTLVVSGTGYVGAGAAQGVYVLFGETSVWSGGGPLVANGWIVQEHVTAGSIVDGRFEVHLEVPAGTP